MNPDLRIAAVAGRQCGTFTRRQAEAAGFTDRMISRRLGCGRWGRLHPCVYRIAGTSPGDDQALFGAWLAAGPGAVVSHLAAARMWGFPRAARAEPEFVVPTAGRRHVRGACVHRTAEIAPVDRVTRDGLSVATPTLTVIQLAARLEPDGLAALLDHCLSRRLTTTTYVRNRLAAVGRAGRPGIAVLDGLLDERPSGSRRPDNDFERDLLALLSRLPGDRPVPQYRVQLPSGRDAYLDAAYPPSRVGVEGDSYLWHSSRIDWSRDHTRNAELTALGWRIIPVTRFDLDTRPEWVLDLVRRACGGEAWRITHPSGG